MSHVLTVMGIIGIPSIFSITLWCLGKCKVFAKQLIILMEAQKAQMRAQLLKDYNEYVLRGYLSQLELDEWENQYQAYHALKGPNGILDDRRLNLFKIEVR